MTLGRLTALQQRVLIVLADIDPPWTLTGGGALAGFHTLHRETRDLDLFFRPQRTLDHVTADVREKLEAAGLVVQNLRTSPAFCQLHVSDEASAIEVDLVADPTPVAEAARPTPCGSVTILVETPYQLLVNKLGALVSRSELRDLVDVRVLLEAGGDLTRALGDCPKQDGGFSPLTFGWAVRGLPVRRLAKSLGWSEAIIDELERFRDELVDRVVTAARPEG